MAENEGIENQGMSLADIAGLDVSDVEELRSSQIPSGLYTFECEPGKLVETTVKDGTETRYVVEIAAKVVEVDTVTEKGVNPEEVMGKIFTEKFFIDPAEAQKGIGYAKGFIADIGAPNTGNMGGVEGAAEGYLDALQGHRFKSKVVKKKGRDGEFYSRLQVVKPKKDA